MDNQFLKRYGPWALVTGASSGIGEQFARQLSQLGLSLVLVARREDRLLKLANELSHSDDIKVRVIKSDLSDDNFMENIIEKTSDIDIGLLINNAGFASTGPFLSSSIQRELELLHVNCRAPMLLAHHFGNLMQARQAGGIVFLGSIVAFAASPQWSQYASSKAYHLMMGEALHEELKESGVDVLALCPGATSTEFQKVAAIRDFMTMSAQDVVKVGLKALGRKSSVIPGFMNSYNIFCLRLLPRWLNTKIFGKVIKKVRINSVAHPKSE